MKLRLFLIALGLILATLACTPPPHIYTLSSLNAAAPIGDTVNVAAYEERYGEYDGVYLFYERVIENSGSQSPTMFSIRGDWRYQAIGRAKYIVFNPRSEQLTTFSMYTEPDELYLKITNPDGTHREFGLEDLRPEMDAYGDTDYRFIFPDVKRGSMIETGYAINYPVSYFMPPLEHVIMLQHSIPAEKIRFTYACPDWWKYQTKAIRANYWPEFKVVKDTAAHKMSFKIERDHVPAVKPERYGPELKEAAEYFQFRITKLKMAAGKYEADFSWEKLGQRLCKGPLKRITNLSLLVQQQTDIVVGTAEDPREKVDRILTFIRDSIEMDGEHRRGNPDEVLRERKATLFDMTALAGAMLRQAGIEYDYLLVNSATDGYFDILYQSPRQFVLPAIGCTIDDYYYTIYPYLDDLPLGVVPYWFLGRPALVIDRDDTRIINLPDSCMVPSRAEESYEVSIMEDGLIKVEEERRLTGNRAFVMRDSLTDMSSDELEAAVKDMLTYTSGSVDLTSHQLENLDEPNQPLILKYEYTIDNLVMVTPEEIIFQTAGLFSPISGSQLIEDPEQRMNEVVVDYRDEYSKSVKIKYPEHWTLVTELEDVERTNDFGALGGQYTLSSGEIEVEQHLKLNRMRKRREFYSELLDIAGDHNDLAIPAIVFRVEAPSSPVGTPAE